MRVCLFEDTKTPQLEPLISVRPVFELICGRSTLGQKQRQYFGTHDYCAVVRPHLKEIYQLENSGVEVNDFTDSNAPVSAMVNGRWLPPDGTLEDRKPHVALIDGEVAYAVVQREQWIDCSPGNMDECMDNWKSTLPQKQAGGRLIQYPWDLVEHNAAQLQQELLSGDFEAGEIPSGVAYSGSNEHLRVSSTARVEPMVFFDVSGGPVVVDDHAVITAFSRIEGPCYIGKHTQVMGANIRAGTTIGPQCRIGGEVEASIIHGYSNKYHEGFLGHAYLCEWVNLGAGTHNSDLRNDYGEVRVPIQGTLTASGLTKVGCFLGDHVKTGLGTLINTGSNIGLFSNLLPAGMLAPKYAPPFSIWWKGKLQEIPDLDPAIETAKTVMQRRGRTLTAAHEQLYRRQYEESAFLRTRTLQEAERRRVTKSA